MWRKFTINLLSLGIAVLLLLLLVSWITIQKRIYKDTVSNLTFQLANIRMIANQRLSTIHAFKRYERRVIKEFITQKANDLYNFVKNLNEMVKDGELKLSSAKEVALNYFKLYKIGKKGYIAILNKKGTLIYHPQKIYIRKNVEALFYLGKKIKEEPTGSMFYIFEGKKKVAAWRYFKPWDWKIVVTAYLKEIPYILPFNFDRELIEKTKRDIVNLRGKGFYIAIYDGSGALLSYPDRALTKDDSPFLGIIKKVIKEEEGMFSYQFNGKKKLKIFTHFRPFDWYIVLSTYPEEKVMPVFSRVLKDLIPYTIIVFALTILAVLVFTRKNYLIPLMALKEGLSRLSKGAYGYRVDVPAKGEVKKIIDAFNRASERLKFHKEEIEASYNELATLNETLKREQQEMKIRRKKLMNLFKIALKTANLTDKKEVAKTIGEQIKQTKKVTGIEISSIENNSISALYMSGDTLNTDLKLQAIKEKKLLKDKNSIVAPIVSKGKSVGLICVYSQYPDKIEEIDEKSLHTLSVYTGILFHLYDTIKELNKQKNRLKILSNAVKAALGSISIEELFSNIGKVVVEEFGHRYMVIHEKVEDRLVLRYLYGYTDKKTSSILKEIAINTRSIIARAARTGNIQYLPDVSKDPDYLEGVKHIKSELAIPIKVEGQVMGVLNVESTKIDDFDPETQNLIIHVTRELSIALQNLKIIEEIKNHLEELKRVTEALKEKEEELKASMNQMEELASELKKVQREISDRNREIERAYRQTIIALVGIVEMKDPYTKGHSERVARLSAYILKKLKPKESTKKIILAGFFHDIGKVGIPGKILNKKEKLTPKEYEEIKKHPVIGATILKEVEYLQDIVPIVKHHHERWDGKGYPDGLKGTEIPLWARIMAVADAFDAMTSDRPYRKGLSIKEALKEVERGAGTQFDPEIAELFIRMMKED